MCTQRVARLFVHPAGCLQAVLHQNTQNLKKQVRLD